MMNEAEHHGIEPEPRARPCPSAIDGMLHISTPCKLPATSQRSTHYFQSAAPQLTDYCNHGHVLSTIGLSFFSGYIALQDFKPLPR